MPFFLRRRIRIAVLVKSSFIEIFQNKLSLGNFYEPFCFIFYLEGLSFIDPFKLHADCRPFLMPKFSPAKILRNRTWFVLIRIC